MGWTESGRAWGERAADWAYLFEPYARRANDALFDRAGMGAGTRLIDIACGSGYAAGVAAGRGAEVSGLDASEALIAIAQQMAQLEEELLAKGNPRLAVPSQTDEAASL